MTELHVVGKPIPRLEGPDKVSGQTVYAADIVLPGMLQAKILRSTVAHARIKSIDTSAAKALPGVHAVVTAADLPPAERDPSIRAHIVLADDEVFFHGQAVAAVAADSVDIAEEAIELIQVEYEPLPVVMDLEAAARWDSPPTRTALGEIDRVEEGGHVTVEVENIDEDARRPVNVTNRLHFRRGDVEKGFQDADIVVEGRFDAAMIHQAYLEPQVTVANYDPNGRLTVYSPTQGQFFQRAEIARILGLPQSHVRYISTECGGGFGAKVPPLVQPLVALLSMKSGRPVKLVLTRREDLAVAVPAPRGLVTAKLGAKNDGTLTTFQAKVMFDAGAFPSGPVIGAAMMIAACYKFHDLDIEGLEVITNKVSCGAYRAPGVPEVTLAVEQLVDEVCRRLGADQIELRRKNAVREGDAMPNGRPWPKIGLVECLDALEGTRLWQTAKKRKNGSRRGIGIAVGAWPGGMQAASALLRLNENGTAQVVVGSNDISGTLTSFAQIAAEELGASIEMVDAVTGDTDSAPFAGMAAGSKTLYSGGKSVQAAAADARRQILQIASHELNANLEDLVVQNGVVSVPDTEKSITFARIAALSTGFGGRYPPVLGRGGEVIRNQAPGFTAQAVEVEVDEATGELTVTGVAATQDVGKAINRMTVEGQLEGGVTQGLGMGLTEEMIYDEQGRLRNPTFLDYRLPTSLDIPFIEGVLVEVPSPEGPFGARIVGEPSIIAGSTALANAVRDATGVRLYEAPLTPQRVAAAVRAKA